MRKKIHPYFYKPALVATYLYVFVAPQGRIISAIGVLANHFQSQYDPEQEAIK
jgi:hypothetical protein